MRSPCALSFGGCGGAAVAYVEPEHARRAPVVIEQSVRHALASVHTGYRPYLKYGMT